MEKLTEQQANVLEALKQQSTQHRKEKEEMRKTQREVRDQLKREYQAVVACREAELKKLVQHQKDEMERKLCASLASLAPKIIN